MVGVQEVADIQEGVVLGAAVIPFEVVPPELDEPETVGAWCTHLGLLPISFILPRLVANLDNDID